MVPAVLGTTFAAMDARDLVTPTRNAASMRSRKTFHALSIKWGFCGTTAEFCDDECQNEGGCQDVERPSCSASTDAMALDVRIGYYGMWGATRDCDTYQPENIPAGALTHINLAFEYVSEDHEITDTQGSIVARVSRLKEKYPGLKVSIALGGWVFNDPPTQYRFSEMASTVPNREKFIASLIRYIRRYGLNGVDLDWEYPVAEDRGGKEEDYNNLVLLCQDIREAFDREDPGWKLTLTLPSSYWYLRGFSLAKLEKYVDWFNVMTYDIHGIWDQWNIWTGPYLKGHTNLTEIEDGMDLLWRNGVSPEKVVMGFGFYGRSFTMSDTQCTTPPNCQFDSAGFAGECTGEAGILSYSEVVSKRGQLSSNEYYDEESSVKWMVYSSNQWISYDDAESFEKKKEYLTSRCLKGLMVWSLDLDTQDYQAMTSLLGERAMESALVDTGLNKQEAEQLAFDLSPWTGELCYTTPTCTDGSSGERTGDQVCKGGFTAVSMAHSPLQRNGDYEMHGECAEDWWRYICCPTKAMPQECEWVGAPDRNVFGCERGCGDSQFELNIDTYVDHEGHGSCYTGARSLCCSGTEILDKCHWTGCEATPIGDPCADDEDYIATRYDDDNGEMCPSEYMGPAHGDRYASRALCCPKEDKFENCDWAVDDCKPSQCPTDKLAVDHAAIPETIFDASLTASRECYGYSIPAMTSPDYKLCCDPPWRYDEEWPVEPSYLWSHYYDDEDDDVSWQFSNNFGNNNQDNRPNDLDDDPGTDPYGFVMLDGPPGSINNAFDEQYTLATRDEPGRMAKRSLVTTNQTTLDSVFEHVEETVLVYCNYPAGSKECREIFYKGAEDTIIRLPAHVGEGPWARVVSMEPVPQSQKDLPSWVVRKRDASENANGVYALTFDYDFHKIKREDTQVNIRVDYTNLLPYWEEITDSPSSRKRSMGEVPSFADWKAMVDEAKAHEPAPQGNRTTQGQLQVRTDQAPNSLSRRWWGSFVNWVKKMTTVTKTDGGVLPMGFMRSLVLYSGRLVCSNEAVTFTAGMDITADFNMEMNARYAYYFSGTVVPPAVTDMYAYVGANPRVYAGVGIRGNAELYYPSERKKIIDTLTYPGLAIKGIAAVGPTMDLWGQIDGRVTVSGDLQVGLTYAFKPVELYFPNNDEAENKLDVEDLHDARINQEGLVPEISGNVRADVDINIHATPEINLGIKVGGGIGSLQGTLADAHVSAFANTTLNFHAQASASTSGGWSYGYSVTFLYRFGFGCVAEIYKYGKWASGLWFPFPQQAIPIISQTVSSGDSADKRGLYNGPELPMQSLPGALFGTHEISNDYWPQADLSTLQTGNWTSSDLLKRADDAQVGKETQFKLGSFQCTTSAGSVCEDVASSFNLKRAPTDLAVRPVYALQKRAATDCPKRIPRLYYNCVSFFSDFTFNGPTGTTNIPGICTNVARFLNNNRRGNTGYTLTWESSSQSNRRGKSCPSNFCDADNAARKLVAFGPGLGPRELTNCDEFPFASVEEGGEAWLGLNPAVTTGTTRTCVPTWMNSMQGNCHNLLNNLETNVNYFNDPKNPTDANEYWASWSQTSWNRKDAWNGRQRLADYPNDQPHTNVPGLTADDRRYPKRSFFQKRNFTLHLAFPQANANPDSQWPDQAFTSGTISGGTGRNRPVTRTVGSSTWIICAVNKMGQQRYRYAGANGYCWDGASTKGAWSSVGQIIRVFQCKITFAGSAGPAKRDGQPLGYFGDDAVLDIEEVQGTEEFHAVPADWEGGSHFV
ncbi:uncharacterized protein DSM5745_07558 [Aspergillus mulundensis]|uniref:chitinase n=1 Tax=Aspergillus mulundensis TaxID=1810919 RepID=A0A3D8REL5_9EURO|nr:hypothetical protein DSM5745_07558 [Aspergillus mulundensis]RDW72386.1 hypothetical protein DSM5745_07558 [Aspergillus mulundensis]